jgi:predicted GIY-YIG superfamily endonuclease
MCRNLTHMPKHYVYVIESVYDRTRYYVGQTRDLKTHLNEHSSGKSLYTQRYKPWRLVSYHAFAEERKALALRANRQFHGSG